jgi:hypothetical protein
MTIRNGTSGWSYAHWKDLFYPSQLARSVEGQGKTLGPMMCLAPNGSHRSHPDRWYNSRDVERT